MQRINMTIKWLMILFLTIHCLIACSTSHKQEIDPTNLDQLENMRETITHQDPTTNEELSQIRVKALEDTAMSLSAQGGLAWSSQDINQRLERDKWNLETIYNFNGLMLNHGILPPVLAQGDNSLNLADPNTIRIADKTYKIIQQARFATTPPHWRDYLWMNYKKPKLPHKVLLPKNNEESKIWRRAIRIGWEKGMQQAYSIFQQNLARLKRDYQGMLLYRRLLEERKISAPYVITTELGVTGDANNMRVNDQILRITTPPQLQTDSRGWKAIVVQHDN